MDKISYISQIQTSEVNYRKIELVAIKIEMLRCFCVVAQTGNLADAARQLGRTQSALSMTLKQLEKHLGNGLFESERKNRLTPLGEQVLTLGLRQLRQFDSTIQAIETSASAPQGLLRVVAVPSIAALVYPPLVQHISSLEPGLQIELRDTDTQQVIDALVQNLADIGIASARHALNGVEVSPLLRDRFGLVCAEAHPLAQNKAPVTISDVLEVPFLRNTLCNHIETPRFRAGLETVNVTVHNTQSLLAMVRLGQWVTVLPRSVMNFAPDGLKFVPITDLPDMRQVYLYRREQAFPGKALQQAHAFIASESWVRD